MAKRSLLSERPSYIQGSLAIQIHLTVILIRNLLNVRKCETHIKVMKNNNRYGYNKVDK